MSIDDYIPEKEGKIFNNWVDEAGNLVEEDTFYPNEASILKVVPKVVNLYATWIDAKGNDDKDSILKEKTASRIVNEDRITVENSYPNTVVPPKTGI